MKNFNKKNQFEILKRKIIASAGLVYDIFKNKCRCRIIVPKCHLFKNKSYVDFDK